MLTDKKMLLVSFDFEQKKIDLRISWVIDLDLDAIIYVVNIYSMVDSTFDGVRSL